MPDAPKIQWTPEQEAELARRANGRTVAVRAAERAKILLESAAGKAKQEIAQKLGIPSDTYFNLLSLILQTFCSRKLESQTES
jgi:DNA-directed RNA polymerase specialized sigma24 family protein